ncbi:hypothetical protein [Methanobrevibacter arboriphilus]|uniref:hypothetical protein n=1 Tax=Methanobrevibacter arboriphilus TaxID=39441 RepID=UPI000A46E04B|nr:hypothetical protein [Methanobrevibacter arboriphilus]
MIIPQFNIINENLIIDFNFNSWGENLSTIGNMTNVRILIGFCAWADLYDILNSKIEIELPSNYLENIVISFETFSYEINNYVFNHNNSKYYDSLQEAFSYANNGDILTVKGSILDFLLYKNLTIIGNGLTINNLLINGSGSGSKILNLNIRNLKITNSNYLNLLNNQIENLLINNSNFNTFFSNNNINNVEIFNSSNLNFSSNQIGTFFYG